MATLCTGTPKITVRDNRGLDVRGLRFNRGVEGDVPTQYVDAQAFNVLGQPVSSQDPRFFGSATLNFQYTPALSGQVLQTVSVDAGTAKSCADIAGRPVWSFSQGCDAAVQSVNHITVQLTYDALGRPVQRTSVTADATTGGPVTGPSDIWSYGDYWGPPATPYDANNIHDPRNANQRGQVYQHFDTAGFIDMGVVGYTVQGNALRQDRRFQLTTCDAITHWQNSTPAGLYSKNRKYLEPDSNPDNLYSSRWTYNALGEVLNQVDAKGHQRQTAYDCAGRKYATSVTPKGGTLTPVCVGISYTATGAIDTRSDANNIQVAYGYEPQTTQRLVSIAASRMAAAGNTDKSARAKPVRASTTPLQALTYAYDGVGNVTGLSDSAASSQVSFFRNRAVTPDRGYTYDALYQLTSATGRENYVNNTPKGTDWPGGAQFSPSSTPHYQAYTRSYAYDCGGNLTAIGSSNWSGAAPPTRQIVVGSASNRAVSTANNAGATSANIDAYFDPAGKNLCLDANRNRPMYWTAFHDLYCVVTTSRAVPSGTFYYADWQNSDREQYAYDDSGQRVRKYVSSMASNGTWNSIDTRYLPGLELRSDTSSGENLEVIILDDGARVLNWAGGAAKPSDIPNLQLRYQYNDRQNSCQIETDSTGNIITQEEYYPYGGTAVLASRTDSEVKYKYIRYSGKERDATGLYYYGLRYYQPWIGRWISPDPAGPTTTQNLYGMVSNNPVTMIDAHGAVEDDPRSMFSRIGDLFGRCLGNPAVSGSVSPSDSYGARALSSGSASDSATATELQPLAPDDGWWPADENAEANLNDKLIAIGIDWVPRYSSWLQDPRGPRAAASDSQTVQDIDRQYGTEAAELWKFAVRYVSKLHESQGVATEERRFARLCQIAEIKTTAWDQDIAGMKAMRRRPLQRVDTLNSSREQARFETWMLGQEKQEQESAPRPAVVEREPDTSAHPADEAAWRRYAYSTNQLLHSTVTLTDDSFKTIGYRFGTADPQRPNHRFMMEVSAGKIRLMEAFRTQKTKEYYADDVTAVHLCAAMRKGIELGGIQLMELNDIINPITRKMLSAHNASRRPAPDIGPDVLYDRWGREDPRFTEFFENSVHGKRVSRLMDDMGKSPTALWRYDYSDADGLDQVDLFLFMEPRGNPRHPALR